MKRICVYTLRFVALVLALSLFSLSAASCGNDTDEDGRFDDLYEALSEYYDAQTDTDVNDGEKNKTLRVVIGAGCGAEIYDSAVFLAAALSKYVGYGVSVEYDSDVSEASDVTEILVGATDRDASVEYLKSLRVDEYGYGYLGGALVIGAHTDELCARCVSAFAEAVEKGDINLSWLQIAESYEVRKEHEIRQIKLCGFELSEYSIVYPSDGKLSEHELAKLLRDKITEYSGYVLRVISDTEASESTRAIYIGGKGAHAEAGYFEIVFGETSNIELLSDTNAGLYHAAEKLMELIKQSEADGICLLDISAGGAHKFSYCSDSLSACAMKGEVKDELDVYVKLIKQIDLCDLTIFEDLNTDAIINLRNNGIVLTSFGEDSFFACNSEKIKCVSAEQKSTEGEVMTSLLFELIADSKKFAVICADDISQLLADECERYSSYPTVIFCKSGGVFSYPNIVSAEKNSAIYYSRNYFTLEEYSSSDIDDGVHADTLVLNFYYT